MTVSKTSLNERTKNSTRRLFYWNLAWVLSLALATFGPKYFWDNSVIVSLITIVTNLVIGLGMIRANIMHVKGLDELHQKIQLEAMGITLGLTLIVGIAYTTLDITNVIPFDAKISFLVIFMGLSYLIAVILGTRRYR
ncbi:hypothetical protein [Pleionea sediminis]|uniref:hypothetical protein n=1 Tax=Pleionea sediminis TaxID=2569479 RepID=UPI001186162B|nr:hypothetical protein [Pleionea sediminis]